MGRPSHRRATRGTLTVTALSGMLVTALVNPATADTDRANGYYVEPGQVHAGNPDGAREWLGTYQVQGEPVFCVDYQLKAPETDEEYEPGDELLTKWGDEIPDERAAKISYLLLRYGNTDSDETAGAVAHLLHSWTADPDYEGGTLGKDVPPEKVAYDPAFHIKAMTGKQRDRVDELDAEAAKFRGPWTAEMTAPTDDQAVGTADEWSVTVETASGTGVPDIPVTVELTGAEPDDADDDADDEDAAQDSEPDGDQDTSTTKAGSDGQHNQAVTADDETGEDNSTTVTTNSDGIATFDATPTDEGVTAHASLRAPAAQPRVQEPIDDSIQTVVSTGGEQELTTEQHVSATPPPPKSTTTTTTETTEVEVPRTIPAGGQPNAVVRGKTTTHVPTGVWTVTGALLLLGAGLAGWLVRRRFTGR